MEVEKYEVPDGAAVFPLIPMELGIHPLLLSTLHAMVFLAGSSDEILNEAAANEALDHLAAYLGRLNRAESRRIREDAECLLSYGQEQGWSTEMLHSLKALLDESGLADDGQI